ncbi:MAG: hypothetical protein R2686_07155 [Candidatus Nanopelagicales bacterium]
MPIPVEGGLLTVTELENHLHRTISATDDTAAQSAVDFAAALVWDMVGFDVVDTDYEVTDNDILVVKGVALRVAAQWFTNPEDRQSYAGPEGLSYTASPQMLSRIMSEADRRTLLGVQLRYAPGIA